MKGEGCWIKSHQGGFHLTRGFPWWGVGVLARIEKWCLPPHVMQRSLERHCRLRCPSSSQSTCQISLELVYAPLSCLLGHTSQGCGCDCSSSSVTYLLGIRWQLFVVVFPHPSSGGPGWNMIEGSLVHGLRSLAAARS